MVACQQPAATTINNEAAETGPDTLAGPASVAATVYKGAIEVSWTDVANAEGYQLYRTDTTIGKTVAISITGTDLSYIDDVETGAATPENLINGHSYYYTVHSISGDNDSNNSTGSRAVLVDGQDYGLLNGSTNSNTVTADVPEYLSQVDLPGSVRVESAIINGTRYAVVRFNANNWYANYSVRFVNGQGYDDMFDTINEIGLPSTGQLYSSFSTPAYVNPYANSAKYFLSPLTAGSAQTRIQITASPIENYYSGNSMLVENNLVYEGLDIVTSFTATRDPADATKATLTWGTVLGATGYDVYQLEEAYDTSWGTWTAATLTEPVVATILPDEEGLTSTASGLVATSNYIFLIVAKDGTAPEFTDTTARSIQASGARITGVGLGSPGSVTAALKGADEDSALLYWNTVKNATGYSIYYRGTGLDGIIDPWALATPTAEGDNPATNLNSETSWAMLSSIDPLKTYSFRVYATDGTYTSQPGTGTLVRSQLGAVQNFAADRITTGDKTSAYLTWDALAGASSYEIYRNQTSSADSMTNNQNWVEVTATPVYNAATDEYYLTDTGLLVAQTYTYRIFGVSTTKGRSTTYDSDTVDAASASAINLRVTDNNSNGGTTTDTSKLWFSFDRVEGASDYAIQIATIDEANFDIGTSNYALLTEFAAPIPAPVQAADDGNRAVFSVNKPQIHNAYMYRIMAKLPGDAEATQIGYWLLGYDLENSMSSNYNTPTTEVMEAADFTVKQSVILSFVDPQPNAYAITIFVDKYTGYNGYNMTADIWRAEADQTDAGSDTSEISAWTKIKTGLTTDSYFIDGSALSTEDDKDAAVAATADPVLGKYYVYRINYKSNTNTAVTGTAYLDEYEGKYGFQPATLFAQLNENVSASYFTFSANGTDGALILPGLSANEDLLTDTDANLYHGSTNAYDMASTNAVQFENTIELADFSGVTEGPTTAPVPANTYYIVLTPAEVTTIKGYTTTGSSADVYLWTEEGSDTNNFDYASGPYDGRQDFTRLNDMNCTPDIYGVSYAASQNFFYGSSAITYKADGSETAIYWQDYDSNYSGTRTGFNNASHVEYQVLKGELFLNGVSMGVIQYTGTTPIPTGAANYVDTIPAGYFYVTKATSGYADAFAGTDSNGQYNLLNVGSAGHYTNPGDYDYDDQIALTAEDVLLLQKPALVKSQGTSGVAASYVKVGATYSNTTDAQWVNVTLYAGDITPLSGAPSSIGNITKQATGDVTATGRVQYAYYNNSALNTPNDLDDGYIYVYYENSNYILLGTVDW